MTPAGPEDKQRQACNQPESNWPQEPVYCFSNRGETENKQTQVGDKDNPRVNSPHHRTPQLNGSFASAIIPKWTITALTGSCRPIPAICEGLLRFRVVPEYLRRCSIRPRERRMCKSEIDTLHSNCIKVVVLNPERTKVIPIPFSPGSFDKRLDDVSHF